MQLSIPASSTTTTLILSDRLHVPHRLSTSATPAAAAPPAALLLLALLPAARAWKQWDNHGTTPQAWRDMWKLDTGPGGRSGHSLVLFDAGGTVIMFGGRDNDRRRRHVPRTYEVTRVQGTLEFVNYDEKPVDECQVRSPTCTFHLYLSDHSTFVLAPV
jgi:hypothetical protein